MNLLKSLTALPLLLALVLPGRVGATPNFEKLQKKLKAMRAAARNRNKFRLPSRGGRRGGRRKMRKHPHLFEMKISKKPINFRRIHSVRLPVDPTLPDCSHKDMKDRTNYRGYRGRITTTPTKVINRKLRWARSYLWENKSSYRYTQVDLCNKGLKKIHQAYCINRNNPSVKQYMKSARALCLPAYKRWWVINKANIQKKSAPLWAYTKATIKKRIKDQLRWLEMDLKNPRKHLSGMKKYLEILALDPNNTRAQQGFDFMYAVYFGTTKAAGQLARTTGKLGGHYDDLTKGALYQLAIDELAGKNNRIVAGVAKTKLDYLGVNYILNKVILPELRKNADIFGPLRCSHILRRKMRRFDAEAVKKEMAKSRGVCSGYSFKFSGWRFMRSPQMKFALIKILAQHTPDPKASIKDAARHLVRQIGAKGQKVCWLYENPYPESVRTTFGKKANCNAFGFSGTHNSRPGFYNFIYGRKPIKKFTKLQNKMAQEILLEAGAKGLAKKFKRAYRRAKGYKCLAWSVTIAMDYDGRGRWSKPYRYSNGGPKEIKCSRLRGNGTFRRIFKSWNNFFDKVVGGRYTRGHWKTKRFWSKRGRRYRWMRRRTRPAEIHVKRKY